MCVDEDLTANGSGLVIGQLFKNDKSGFNCSGRPVYANCIQYDSSQLADPDVLLRSCDIKSAFCSGCLKQYVDWKSQHPVIGGYTFTYPATEPEEGQLLAIGELDEDTMTGTLVLVDP